MKFKAHNCKVIDTRHYDDPKLDSVGYKRRREPQKVQVKRKPHASGRLA
jgi:hypothetical protein